MTENELLPILEANYHFDHVTQVKLLKGGVSNENYLFSDGGNKYVARVCLFEPENQINSLIPFLKYAKKAPYPAPRLVQTKDGQDYIQNGNNPVVVTEYLEADSADKVSINVHHVQSLAQLLANLHKLEYTPPNTPITLDPEYIFNLYDRIADYNPTNKDVDSQRMIDLVDMYYKKFKDMKFTNVVKSFSHGVTHGDVNLGNVLVNDNEAISLIDFEETGASWQLQDIAMVLVTWAFPGGKPNKEFIMTFLNEYQQHNPFTILEKDNIINVTEFIAFRQCVYAKNMMSKGNMQSVKDFSSYWTLLHLHKTGLSL